MTRLSRAGPSAGTSGAFERPLGRCPGAAKARHVFSHLAKIPESGLVGAKRALVCMATCRLSRGYRLGRDFFSDLD